MDRRTFFRAVGASGGAAALGACAPGTSLPTDPVTGLPSFPDDPLELLWPADARRRLYRYRPRHPDRPTALAVAGSRSALVVGGGIAGLSAALELVEAGYRVEVREAADVWGGRLATRDLDPGFGRTFRVEHGLHMWFDNYRVFKDIRSRLGMTRFRPYDAVNFRFKDPALAPERVRSEPKIFPLNLVRLVDESPNLDWDDVLNSAGMLPDLMAFEMTGLYDRLDELTFVDWLADRRIDPRFRDVFLLPAAHVTLNRVSTLSAAEMLLYQHLYFISQPYAFDREITTEDFGTVVIDPWVASLRSRGATMSTGAAVPGLRFVGDKAIGVVGEATDYDWVVLSTDVPGVHRVMAGSTADGAATPRLAAIRAQLGGLELAPPYRILRIWTDRRLPTTYPDLIETPQHDPLALIIQFHQLEGESRAWAAQTGGGIYEFHLYSIDPELEAVADDRVWEAISPVVTQVVPELAGHRVLGSTVGNHHDFTSFATGQGKRRPSVTGLSRHGITNLLCAGDWVHADTPSALMERAVLTGRLAANAIRDANGVREVGYEFVSTSGPGWT